jgi:hypothetical protein
MQLVKEGLENPKENPYSRINILLSEILCANGTCPII